MKLPKLLTLAASLAMISSSAIAQLWTDPQGENLPLDFKIQGEYADEEMGHCSGKG